MLDKKTEQVRKTEQDIESKLIKRVKEINNLMKKRKNVRQRERKNKVLEKVI